MVHTLLLNPGTRPIAWATWQELVVLSCRGMIQQQMGEVVYRVRGGVSRDTGERSLMEVPSIAVVSQARHPGDRVPLPRRENRELYRRDDWTCLYCGGRFDRRELSRDHVQPLSRGGLDRWENVATACRRCNRVKGSRVPEEARMPLLAVPYAPVHAEWMVLTGRDIRGDQMEILRAHLPRSSPLRLDSPRVA
ncbi:MAG: HNH endonuclease [Thiohalorhabdaceae bacterium]